MGCFASRPIAAREVVGCYYGIIAFSDFDRELFDDETYREDIISRSNGEMFELGSVPG